MINLIPNQEKKKKARDFYFRLAAVSLVALGFCVLIAAVSVLPALFISSANKNFVNAKLEMQKREPVPLIDQGSLSVMRDLNGKLALIENAEKNKYLVSQKIINEIAFQKMPDIKINQISYENNPGNGKKISIRGIAPSRERLLLFRRALEDSVAFKKVALPISNFVKGSDIEFYLNLIPAQ